MVSCALRLSERVKGQLLGVAIVVEGSHVGLWWQAVVTLVVVKVVGGRKLGLYCQQALFESS